MSQRSDQRAERIQETLSGPTSWPRHHSDWIAFRRERKPTRHERDNRVWLAAKIRPILTGQPADPVAASMAADEWYRRERERSEVDFLVKATRMALRKGWPTPAPGSLEYSVLDWLGAARLFVEVIPFGDPNVIVRHLEALAIAEPNEERWWGLLWELSISYACYQKLVRTAIRRLRCTTGMTAEYYRDNRAHVDAFVDQQIVRPDGFQDDVWLDLVRFVRKLERHFCQQACSVRLFGSYARGSGMRFE